MVPIRDHLHADRGPVGYRIAFTHTNIPESVATARSLPVRRGVRVPPAVRRCGTSRVPWIVHRPMSSRWRAVEVRSAASAGSVGCRAAPASSSPRGDPLAWRAGLSVVLLGVVAWCGPIGAQAPPRRSAASASVRITIPPVAVIRAIEATTAVGRSAGGLELETALTVSSNGTFSVAAYLIAGTRSIPDGREPRPGSPAVAEPGAAPRQERGLRARVEGGRCRACRVVLRYRLPPGTPYDAGHPGRAIRFIISTR